MTGYTETMDLKPVLEVLERHSEVCLAYVFGSVAEGRETKKSDLDIGVFFIPTAELQTYIRLKTELERAANRTVDLVDLSCAPPLLAHHVISRGRLVLARDEDQRVALLTRTVARYLDTAHLRQVQHQYLRERAEAHHAPSG